MIYARSPYIIYDNTAGLEDVEFTLYVYLGTKDTDKATGMSWTFAVDAINGSVEFDISPFIREYLKSVTIGPTGTGRYAWVTTEIDKDTGSGLSGSPSTYEATQPACYGYTTPEQGVNYTSYIPNPLITDVEAYSDLAVVNLFKGEGTTMEVPILLNNQYLGVNDYTITFYPNSGGTGTAISSVDATATDTDESSDRMKYITLPANAKSLVWEDDSATFSVTREITLVDECKNPVTRVFFINKFGVKEEIQFFGRAIESYESDEDQYKRTILSGGTYSLWDRQMSSLNKRAKKKVEISTGLYPEGYNSAFKQLMLSEDVWILDNGASAGTSNNYKAVNIVDSDFTYKYSRYDKKIEYTFTFEYANSEINDIA
jgi:hypothetical protein